MKVNRGRGLTVDAGVFGPKYLEVDEADLRLAVDLTWLKWWMVAMVIVNTPIPVHIPGDHRVKNTEPNSILPPFSHPNIYTKYMYLNNNL